MASITLRPTSGTGTNWTNVPNIYDGDQSTSGSVSVSRLNYTSNTLVLNFDTSVIPSGATINSATLTIRSQGGKNTITAYVDINQDSANRVINKKQSTSAANYTADVTSYMSNLTSVEVTGYNSNWSANTFVLYELWIDVDYTEAQKYNRLVINVNENWGYVYENLENKTYNFTNNTLTIQKNVDEDINVTVYPNEGYIITKVSDSAFTDEGSMTSYPIGVNASLFGYDQTMTYDVTFAESTAVKNIKLGDVTINDIYIGSTRISKIYIGDTLIFEN